MTLLRSKGVLLTLGITFISLIVLSFATLILRNAENSDLRLTELSSVDRVYTLSSSLEHSLFRSYYALTGINFTTYNDTVVIVKDTTRAGTPNYYQPPDFLDTTIGGMKISDVYVQLLAESLTYNTATLANVLGYLFPRYLALVFYYPEYSADAFSSLLLYAYSDYELNFTKIGSYNFRHQGSTAAYCCFEVNNNSAMYPQNSTFQFFLLGNSINNAPQKNIKDIRIKATHPTRCPVVNWSADGTKRLSGDPSPGEANIQMTIRVENIKDSCPGTFPYYYDFSKFAIINRTGELFSQIIFLDNLTNDDLTTPGYNFISVYDPNMPSNPSRERPTILIYDQNISGDQFMQTSNILALIQYDNPILWEVTLKYDVGPIEVYSTETVSATLSALNVSRVQRPARFK